jgi:NitT/TauT family transport system permease protein
MNERFWVPLAVLVLWQVIAALGLINSLILPSPVATFGAVIQHGSVLVYDTSATLGRLAVGFLIGSCVGIVVGALFGISQRVYGLFELPIDFFRSLPVITLFPLTMIIFGLGNASKIALTTWTVFLLTVVNTSYGIKQVPKTRILAAKTLGARGRALLLKVLLPSALPTIVSGLRLTVSLGLVVVLVTEMFTGTASGLGKRIYDYGLIYETPGMYAAIIVAGALGFLLNKLIVALEGRFTHWSGM